MQVKDRVLEALEGHRGTYFSGEALAKELQVSRNAVWKAIRQLRDQGYPIHAVSNRGYSLAPDSAMLSPQSIAPFLTVPGLQVEVQPVVTSTNQVLRQRAEEGAHEGLALVAVTQTAGRGRRDHSFFSPPDSGLYLSFLLRPDLSARDALSLTTCAAASVGFALGLDLATIAAALGASVPEPGRQEVIAARGGFTVINDAYNASPDSMRASLATFAATDVAGRRIAVLGDMGELGSFAPACHEGVGAAAASHHLDKLICIGELARHIAAGAEAAGMDAARISRADTVADVLEELDALLEPGDAVLVKASHFMGLTRIVEGLVN